jgi:hypothetical protein
MFLTSVTQLCEAYVKHMYNICVYMDAIKTARYRNRSSAF